MSDLCNNFPDLVQSQHSHQQEQVEQLRRRHEMELEQLRQDAQQQAMLFGDSWGVHVVSSSCPGQQFMTLL